ncbi:MAG: 4-hydroxy-tetrahydrodipicolinate reductase [Candidatus Margulisiibacteriota bacterium]|nr:MAG: 4-hydroxy-tetrahydrodipicolinate reductase [Candidatus Margulisbacteria bacterium GWD2_39_127]OGI01586.1 MAG: 4-hydroxy-tetrahydrodipicolinate reductase [Candidatus Margulisbacteria bacterium GWF2_38_17]OGI10028.1 MAG: 4-hydroxy-tetrahydrodipicolinate reductase [Candidatus Margulisbacteria bacterium GWE2_39_32]PZM78283.1 MAG: 4-hydroxy-tetrahydrodipicolinate reductase [Candidatus Margulisiibacteriota bacterium]HAR61829.1 4-hydroxy-tetrahydrodipicolinate reductase [Candidatus Margulisiib
MINVIVSGYKGRVGQEIAKAIVKDPELQMAGGVDVGDDLAQMIKDTKADVVVDFTHPSVRLENFLTIIEHGARPVVGTTGYNENEIADLQVMCREKNIGAIIAPNFAIGAILMMKFAAQAAKYLDCAEIVELHHEKKEDFPSGTAVKTAQLMLNVRQEFNKDVKDKVVNLEGARGANAGGIHIHSVRLPGFVAHQEVIFGTLGQTLTIRHDSISRESFMPGVIMAVKKVMTINELIYGLENII